ncbi:MAG TPA: YggS family pyridoxal phosphate-dependent enzyme [Thermomicrobiales bacterium]|jgi:hypothetical protein|nr:YggS family pyridoxal phosphate-dependent enzyme [Thermomicrobiales bacterium]
MTNLRDRLDAIRERIAAAAERSGRSADAIQLVGVSKTVDRDVVLDAVAAGLTHFGENRVQDASRKFAELPGEDVRLHMIGPLQTNKARAACKVAHMIESVDRPGLIEVLASETGKLAASGDLRAGDRLPVLLQVNVAREPQKSGCAPEEAAGLVEAIMAVPTLDLRGLMTIAPLVDDPDDVRPTFAALRDLRDDLARQFPGAALDMLSMGMTNDFEQAIAEGATSIRVGRAIFLP